MRFRSFCFMALRACFCGSSWIAGALRSRLTCLKLPAGNDLSGACPNTLRRALQGKRSKLASSIQLMSYKMQIFRRPNCTSSVYRISLFTCVHPGVSPLIFAVAGEDDLPALTRLPLPGADPAVCASASCLMLYRRENGNSCLSRREII